MLPQYENQVNELEALVENGELISSDMNTGHTQGFNWVDKHYHCTKYIRTYFDLEGNEVHTVERYFDESKGFEIFDYPKEIKQPEPKIC